MTQDVTEPVLPTPKERRRLREAADLTHEEVAEQVGVTPTTVRSWETGRTDPRGRKRDAYAELLSRLSTEPGPPLTPDQPAHPAEESATAAAAVRTTAAAADAAQSGADGLPPALTGSAVEQPGAGAAQPGTFALAATAAGPPGALTADQMAATAEDDAARAGAAVRGVRGFGGGWQGRAAGSQTWPKAAVKRAAKPPAGMPRHEVKATVRTGGGSGPATLRPGWSTGGAPEPGPGGSTGGDDEVPGAGPGSSAGGDGRVPQAGAGGSAGGDGRVPQAGAGGSAGGDGRVPQAGPGAGGDGGVPEAVGGGPGAVAGGPPEATADTGPPDPGPGPEAAAETAFDRLHARTAGALARQVYLLTGRHALALESVERAFHQAWQRWPEVATDPDPVGWVRAAAYEHALSPWHVVRRTHRDPDKPPAALTDRILLDAMLALPPAHRRTVLLYDGVGLDLPDTAAETEASTPTAGSRLVHAHAELADRIPELAAVAPEKQSALLRERLGSLRPAVPLQPRPAAEVRNACEYRARRWTRAALGLTAVIAVATAYTAVTAPTQFVPPDSPGASVSGVPPLSGPQRLTDQGRQLHDKLRTDPSAGTARIHPVPE
ncbi:helix-turn-helix domain-containing protein [Streptomyces sp. NPDC051183]|uniref:helix-turn-helix domain-containing protein n=1 Tax=Streptomyces sp. NPDC051183 TaxID=3155165 RepID=UPI003448FF1B